MVYSFKITLKLLIINLFTYFLLLGCNIKKETASSYNTNKHTYIDSTVFKINKVEINSIELINAIEDLKREFLELSSSDYYPDYQYFIIVTMFEIEQQLYLKMHITHSYMITFAIPGAENTNPLHETNYPIIPTLCGLEFVNGTPIIFHNTICKWSIHNPKGNFTIIARTDDTLNMKAYGHRYSENDEWVFWVLPSISVFYRVIGDEMIFERYLYDKTGTDGIIQN